MLLGRPKTQTTLEIDDYIWVSSDQPGSQYHLDASELERLSAFYTFVVGYFRTQPGDEMRLRAEEITFFGKHFTDATNVALLVHTSRRPYTAGFFFGMKSVLSPIFPLDAELLRSQAEPRRTEAGVTRTGPEVEMTLPLLASSGKDAAEDMDARQPHRFPDLERT